MDGYFELEHICCNEVGVLAVGYCPAVPAVRYIPVKKFITGLNALVQTSRMRKNCCLP